MKIKNEFRNLSFILIPICILFYNCSIAQSNGILPLTGMKFFNEGIGATAIDIKIDGSFLLNNKIPLNKEIEIRLQQPNGFTTDMNKTMFAGAEVIVLSPKGELLLNDPNLLSKNYSKGFSVKDLQLFSIKFGIGAEALKGNITGLIKIRLYDLKGRTS